MGPEITIEDIKTELESADAATLTSIWQTLRESKPKSVEFPEAAGDLASRHSTKTALGKPTKFIGENPPFNPNRDLSFEDRAVAKRHLKAKNREWLLQKFKDLQAAWIMVTDGQVIASGATLSDYPEPEEILSVCHRTGKFPFLFINEDFLAIEEGGVAWQSTNNPDDAYPTIPVMLRSNTNAVSIIADFDTGASSIFVDYNLLVKHNVIHLKVQEEPESAQHLNQTYEYLLRKVTVETVLASGEIRSQEVKIACVAGWQKSPFIKVNPTRTALVGREIFLRLKPCILLDFEKQQTEIWSPAIIHQALQNTIVSAKNSEVIAE